MGFDTGGFAGGGSGGGGGASSEFGLYRSALIDFKTAAVIPCNLPVVVPAGKVFFPDEIGIAVVAYVGPGAVVQPTVSWGINGNTAKYKTAALMLGLTGANLRDWFTSLLSADGIPFGTTPTAEITVPASGITTFTGYIYFNGVNLP